MIAVSALIGMTSTYYEHKYIKQIKEYKADEHEPNEDEPVVSGKTDASTPLLNPSANPTYSACSTTFDINGTAAPTPITGATSHESATLESTAALRSPAPLVVPTDSRIPPGSAATAAAGIASIANTMATTSTSIHGATDVRATTATR